MNTRSTWPFVNGRTTLIPKWCGRKRQAKLNATGETNSRRLGWNLYQRPTPHRAVRSESLASMMLISTSVTNTQHPGVEGGQLPTHEKWCAALCCDRRLRCCDACRAHAKYPKLMFKIKGPKSSPTVIPPHRRTWLSPCVVRKINGKTQTNRRFVTLTLTLMVDTEPYAKRSFLLVALRSSLSKLGRKTVRSGSGNIRLHTYNSFYRRFAVAVTYFGTTISKNNDVQG